jgi:hypothetical protein
MLGRLFLSEFHAHKRQLRLIASFRDIPAIRGVHRTQRNQMLSAFLSTMLHLMAAKAAFVFDPAFSLLSYCLESLGSRTSLRR